MTLRVTLEIIPFGDEEDARVIETINISNQGRKLDPAYCRYLVEHNCYKTGEGLDVIHRRDQGALMLAYLALGKLIENKEEDDR